MAENRFGGYNAHFLHELSDEYECPVCKMALCKPLLTVCGHRFCLSCSEEMRKRNNGVLKCPLDNNILNSKEIFLDRAIERVILGLKVKCNNFLKNCHWTGELRTINNHLTSCEYQEKKCFNCATSLLRKDISLHMKVKCIYRLILCQHCNQEMLFSEMQAHLERCECLQLYCVNQCGMKIVRKEMSTHIMDSCANTIIPCQYKIIGCIFKGMRKDYNTHVSSSSQIHLSMALSKVYELQNNEEVLEGRILHLKYNMETREKHDAQIIFSREKQLSKAKKKVLELQNEIIQIEEKMLNNKMTEKLNTEDKKTLSARETEPPEYENQEETQKATPICRHGVIDGCVKCRTNVLDSKKEVKKNNCYQS
nr:TNF receptor-associated factor 6 [Hydra vulgaris]